MRRVIQARLPGSKEQLGKHAFEDRLGKLRSGRSYIDWKPSKQVSIDELEVLANEMLAEAAKRI